MITMVVPKLPVEQMHPLDVIDSQGGFDPVSSMTAYPVPSDELANTPSAMLGPRLLSCTHGIALGA